MLQQKKEQTETAVNNGEKDYYEIPLTWPSGLLNFICVPRVWRLRFTYFKKLSAVLLARVHACNVSLPPLLQVLAF